MPTRTKQTDAGPSKAELRVAAEAARRASRASRLRVAGALVIRGADDRGASYTLVTTRTLPGVAYILTRRSDGSWECGCPLAGWGRVCIHLEAVEAAAEGVADGD